MSLKDLDNYGLPQRTVNRFDSLSMFVENELKTVVPQTYDRKFRELDALEHVPLANISIDPYEMVWAYDQWDMRGEAKFLAANATDMPRADASKERLSFQVRTIVSAYGWSLEEMEVCRSRGVALDQRKATAARRSIAELEHSVILNGNAAHGLGGFLTNPDVPVMTVPNGNWLDSGTTADEILEDMNTLVDKVWIGSNKLHKPNTLTMPLAHYRKITTARIPNTDVSVMTYFMANNKFISSVVPLIEMVTAGPGSAPRMIAYDKSPDNCGAIIPMPFQQLDPQLQGFEVVIPCRERIGGVVWFYPLSGCFGDGI